ncbi:hypothetical protein BCR34DRAFT_446546, partial [Clohesyomyces aquaticus]
PISSIIHLHDPNSPTKPETHTYLIYFITGNPGLIEYYRTFLTHLYGLLYPCHNIQVFGRNLSGFETNSSPSIKPSENFTSHTLHLGEKEGAPPYGLEEQIRHCQLALEDLVAGLRTPAEDVRVILIGHSVGSYILLELIRRLRLQTATSQDNPSTEIRVAGGICLFPTVAHIAQSSSGKKSTWILNHAPFALTASVLVKVLMLFVPGMLLEFFIRSLMSFPGDAARVTGAFVKSSWGVRQALHMARDEMLTITSDKWDAEIWGAAHPTEHPHPRPVLRFLFAKEDHWVADETRDDLMRARGKVDDDEHWKPVMEVDEEEGWPHGFCIKHSIPVAERVKDYIEDVIRKDIE